MNIAKFLRGKRFQNNRFVQTQNQMIQNLRKNENTSFDKNTLLYNYVKKTNSNAHYLMLPDVFNFWLKVPEDKLIGIREVADYILHGVILVDDVQDGTQFRRNLPSTNRIYGVPLAVNASMFCYIAAINKLAEFRHPTMVNVYCEEAMSALEGVALDLYWRDACFCPTEDEYIEMAKKKTGSYILLVFRLLQCLSEDRRNFRELVTTYSLYYQIRDDYANLANVQRLDTKSREAEFKDLHNLMFCEDIEEGKFTWPIIHGINSSEGPTIRSILVKRTNDSKIKKYCLSLLEKAGSLEYTRQTLHDLETDLRDQINRFGGNPVFMAYLDELSNWK